MSQKDFVLIAETIRTAELDVRSRIALARAFADRLAATNPRFKRATFLRACHATNA